MGGIGFIKMSKDTTTPQFISSENADVQEIDQYMTVKEYFGKEDIEEASLVSATLDGPHDSRVNHRSEKTYYLIEGTAELTVEGESIELSARDAAVVPPGKTHSLYGNEAELLMIVSPPYDPEDEELR